MFALALFLVSKGRKFQFEQFYVDYDCFSCYKSITLVPSLKQQHSPEKQQLYLRRLESLWNVSLVQVPLRAELEPPGSAERSQRPAASRRRPTLASLPPQVRLRGVRRRARRGRRRVRAEREGPVRGASDRGARPGPPPRQLVRFRTQ